MKDFRKEADGDLVRLWERLERKGFRPIKHQFQWLRGKGKSDLLNSIRSAWNEYIKNADNFNDDGTLKRKLDLFPVDLCVDKPIENNSNAVNSINFSLDYTPEIGLHVNHMYLLRVCKKEEIIEINIKHKPSDPPSVRDLNMLMRKTDNEWVRPNEGRITKDIDLSNKAKKLGMRK